MLSERLLARRSLRLLPGWRRLRHPFAPRLHWRLCPTRHYRPPPNFAKDKDKRFVAYVRQFGTTECWELDALSPTVISDLIRNEIEALIDQKLWRKALASEDSGRKILARVADNWTKVEKMLRRAEEV